ncbi:MAG: hypothetical protein GY730_11660 [bacterium]|nr:hypothetical protein [bacterium]
MRLPQNRKRWHYCNIDQEKINKLSSELNLDPLLAKILLARNTGNGKKEEILKFICPPDTMITDTYGVSSPENLLKATERLQRAIALEEKVMVQGDPDADGTTGAAVLIIGLKALGLDVYYDFPIRPVEGHGIQTRIIDQSKKLKANLLITSDCGSNDVVVTNYANSVGIDVIITDHHKISKNLPDAYAIINPFLVPDDNPAKFLAGAGVSFKLILAIFERLGRTISKDLMDHLLAITALGTISDRMSFISPMNRIIVKKGIEALNNTHKEGLRALKMISGSYIKKYKARNISRTISPRLNAPGRIGNRHENIPDSRIVVDLLILGTGKKNAKKANKVLKKFDYVIEKDLRIKQEPHAQKEALLVDDVNEKRKYITVAIENEIDRLIKEQVKDTDKITIIKGHNWNPGVIGIDTDRLRDRFLRPAMILTEYTNSPYIRASIRSIPTINMYKIMECVINKFEAKHNRSIFKVEVETMLGKRMVNAFGGHAQACGFTFHKNDISELLRIIRLEMDSLPEDKFKYSYEIIDETKYQDINHNLINKLDTLMPYGQVFEYPLFIIKNCTLSKARSFGNKYQKNRTPHVEFLVLRPENISIKSAPAHIDAVGFGLWEQYCEVVSNNTGTKYDLIFTVDIDHHKSKKGTSKSRLRLNVMDIRRAEC